MSGGTLIVGAGEAAIQLAISLRQRGADHPITVVGSEAHEPYQRPPLSKAFLAGTAEARSLVLRTPEFYRERDIDVVTGARIEQIALTPAGPPGAGTAVAAGREFPFDRLALAVGARPRRIDSPGSELAGMFALRDLDDARQLREALRDANRVVVVGGGYIGLETAAVARAYGKSVVVIEAADRLVSRSVAATMSAFLHSAHVDRGVDVRLNATVERFVGTNGRVSGVALHNGPTLPADLVLIAVGVEPRTELAEQLGLACDGGILVDEFARTSEPSVVAIGDCAVVPNPMTGRGRVRLESTPNAISQAKAAAATMTGHLEPYRAVPWFWSDQYELKLQIAGLTNDHDLHVVRGDPASETFSVLYYRHDELIAVNAVNRPADYMVVRQALTRGATIPPGQAADMTVSLRHLIVERGRTTVA